MRALFDAVIAWGERLVYTGTKDDALPPKVNAALDAYLGESNSKVLVIMPLVDDRDKERKRPARSALLMECFETNLQTEQLLARLDVVGRHAAPALYNALEYRRIPMRFLWLPLAYVQDGLGGKAKAITALVLAGLTILILAMIFVPFPHKMEADGQALTIKRSWIFAPIPGKVEHITEGLKSGSKVSKGQVLLTLYDADLAKQITELQTEIETLKIEAGPAPRNPDADGKGVDNLANQKAKTTLEKKIIMRERLKQRYNADLAKPGYFHITSPQNGIILSADFRENLFGRVVKPGDPLMRIGFTDPENPKLSDWEIELKIPQKHVGQVRRAFEGKPAGTELDVDVLVKSDPTTSYRVKLRKDKIAQQANAEKTENNEAEPIVLAWARANPHKILVDGKEVDDIPPDRQIPPARFLSGLEVRTRIRCGDAAMGYSLFYGVYEFAYEKVIFPYNWK
jgi:hypothetical protein